MSQRRETTYEALRNQGVSRREFLKFCALTAVALGLGPGADRVIAAALETKPRVPVVWINGLSCTCCTESFLRTAHPLASNIILSMITLDYQDTIMAAAGQQAEEAFDEAINRYRGEYLLAVEGNAPLGAHGMYCFESGRPFLDKLRRGADHAKAVIAWGSCASWGCIQAAYPNPTQARPLDELIHNTPLIKVPGCPPIPEVMSTILTYIITYDQMPALDAQGRPEMFYGKRVHDQCYRRAHFDAGEYVESWDDAGAREGLCLYKMGCKGPTTYNACSSTRWNDGVSFPIQSGHGCIGCSEQNFWDQQSFYDRITTIPHFGTNSTAETVGVAAIAGVAGAVAVHGIASMIRHARSLKVDEPKSATPESTVVVVAVPPDPQTPPAPPVAEVPASMPSHGTQASDTTVSGTTAGDNERVK